MLKQMYACMWAWSLARSSTAGPSSAPSFCFFIGFAVPGLRLGLFLRARTLFPSRFDRLPFAEENEQHKKKKQSGPDGDCKG